MLLQEFIYFEKDSGDLKSNDRYDSDRDTSVIINKDTRKMRLTFEMLNSLRKAGDAREQETREDLELVRIMYAIPEEPTE
jgi:hypothetical protein